MRKGLRRTLWVICLVPGPWAVPGDARAAKSARSADPVVRMTLEVRWEAPAPRPLASMAVSASVGRIAEVVEVSAAGDQAATKVGGSWALPASRSGRARMRVEAPLGGSILVRRGDRTTAFALAQLVEGPEQASDPGGADLTVERLAWDALEVAVGGDGTAVPGSTLAATIGLNVLGAEPGDAAARLSVEVRPAAGGPPIWRADRAEVVAIDAATTPTIPLDVPAPEAEGTYVLEVRATWEALATADKGRIARLLRKRRPGAPTSATRRSTFVVIGPRPPSKSDAAAGPAPRTAPGVEAESVVDSIDARARTYRPTATGRARLAGLDSPWEIPESVLAEVQGRPASRIWSARPGVEGALPAADASGVAWAAVALRVPHPGRPHRLSVSASGGRPSSLEVALIAPGGDRPRVLLDACGSGPATADGAAPTASAWSVWPDAAEPTLVLLNRGPTPLRLGSIELVELPAQAAPAPMAETHGEAGRRLMIDLSGPGGLDRFGGLGGGGGDGASADPLASARNLSAYLLQGGASGVVLPASLADRAGRRALDGQVAEDATGPDRLALTLRLLARHGLSALLALPIDGRLPGLPAADSPEALAAGLVRVDREGRADGPSYQPLRREVRAAIVRRAAEAAAARRSHPNLAGVLVRLGPGASLPGGPEVGLDDETYGRFARETFGAEGAKDRPGLAPTGGPGRFGARRQYLAGPGHLPWLSWRAQQVGELYGQVADAVHGAAPGAALVVATPDLDDGPAGDEARRGDLSGASPKLAWRAVGLDLAAWPDRPNLVVLRTVGPSTDDLGHDLAVSPELDEPVAARRGRGVLVQGPPPAPAASDGPVLAAIPASDGPAADEALGHAVAAIDARWAVVAGPVASGREDRLRRFARVFRALPDLDESDPGAVGPARAATGAAIRSWTAGGGSYLGMANDTPYTVVVETILAAPAAAPVEDLGRGRALDVPPGDGGRRLVVEVPPFGLAAIRVGHPGVSAGPFSTYLVGKRDIDARAETLSTLLDRPAPATAPAGPPNPGCEPAGEVRTVSSAAPTPGWSAMEPGAALAIDAEAPHAGRGSLRIEARSLPASAAGPSFAAPAGAPLTLRLWLRSSPPGLPVRAWVEGQSGGRSIARRADLAPRGDWSEFLVRTDDLPAGGLDRARIRVEPLAAGRVWVDDVRLVGPGGSEPDRRSRRALTAAVHAYREGRYADFARLAGSSWARRIGPGPLPEPDPSMTPPLPGEAQGPIRTGAATGLSSGRRLR